MWLGRAPPPAAEQRIQIGVATIGIEAVPQHIDLKPVGRIADDGGVGEDKAPELLLPPCGEEGGELQGAQLRTDADRPQIVPDRLAHAEDWWERGQVAGIKPLWIASLGE